MGVNSLPKTATRQRRDCDLNPGPSASESSTLTTRLPSHPILQFRKINLLCSLLYFPAHFRSLCTTRARHFAVSYVRNNSAPTLVSRITVRRWPHCSPGSGRDRYLSPAPRLQQTGRTPPLLTGCRSTGQTDRQTDGRTPDWARPSSCQLARHGH